MDERAIELERLYRRRYVAFRNGLLGLTGNLEAAKDATQEGFARALRDRHQFRGDGTLEAWVWRIAFRAALGIRGRGGDARWDDAVDEAAVPSERDPELAAALRALPPRRRLIVFLRYFADLSYAEIAALCEISEGTVAASLAHARADLAAALTTEGAPR